MAKFASTIANIGELLGYARKYQHREVEEDLLAAFFASRLQHMEDEAEEAAVLARKRRAQTNRSRMP